MIIRKVVLFLILNQFWVNKEKMMLRANCLVVYQLFKKFNDGTREMMIRKESKRGKQKQKQTTSKKQK